MTQPTDGEIWKMWETDEGSMSLSCGWRYRLDQVCQVKDCAVVLSQKKVPVRQPLAQLLMQPTDGEIWKMWETDEGSMSLSCGWRYRLDQV